MNSGKGGKEVRGGGVCGVWLSFPYNGGRVYRGEWFINEVC